MSNYTQTTFFTPKDTLPITDPNKTIFGAAYDVEFANISSALTTKLDSTFVNPALVNLNVTTNAIPVNGIYLPSANTLGIATNTTFLASFSQGGSVFGTATGGAQGVGTINAQGLFVNGSAVLTSAGAGATVIGTGTAVLNASGIAVGQTYIVWRSANSAARGTGTNAIDTVLQLTNIPNGTYVYTTQLQIQNNAANTNNLNWTMNSSAGTVTGSVISGYSVTQLGVGNTSGGQYGFASSAGSFSTTTFQSAGASVAAAWSGQATMTGIFTVTSAATVGPFWSGGASTTSLVNAGSFVSITRLA